MLYFPMDFGELNIDGLIDTGALSSAIPEADLRKIRLLAPQSILNEGPPPEFQIMVANGQLEAPIATVELQFEVGDITFREKFIVMTNLTSPLIGLLFLQRNSTILDMRQGILNFPFFSMQLKNEDRTYPNVIEPIINPVDTILQPGKRTTIWVKSQIYTENEATGIIQPSPLLENDEDLLICPAISSTQNNKHMVQISNFLDHPYTLKKGTHMANFSILTPEQTKHIRPVNPTSVRHLLNNNHDDAIHYINSLLKTSKPDEVNETYWFPTPQNPGNEKEHTPIQTRILNELRELEQLEKLNPLANSDSRNQFLSNFDWTNSTLQRDAKQAVENLLVEFHDIFARHRFDIGINTEFKVQLTPLDNRPAYSQSLPAPINLKDDILVELALLHKYGIITTLPFSKYASPIFAQRKPNGKLRLLVDLRKINTLIADDYINNNHPVSTLTDAAQHMAGKNLFCKLDCSQAYHCLQMADQQSIELLAFNFASRTFAYRRLAQGLSRSLSAFSSFIREYLDPVIKADQCAQYVDDIGIAANTPEQLIKNLRAVFQCLRKAGLKLSMIKCHFGVQEVDFLGRTITTKGVAPQKQKIARFLEKVKFPRSKKALQRYIGFLNYYRNYIPRLAERLTPFFQLLKATDAKTKIPITPDIMKEFREINEALDRCCQLALRQPLPGKQLVLMTDASFQAAGYAVLIEDDPNQKFTSTRKTYAPIAYGSKTYSPSQIKMSIYAKEFLAIYMAFKEFGHIFWGATKPVIIMTDSKSVTRFFQTKMIPPPLWNACDFVLQFNFTIAHIPGKMNTAADFLSRLEMDPNEKIILKIREDIPTKPIEVNIESTGIAQEEQVFSDPTDQQETTENELWQRKEEVRNAIPNEPPVITVSCYYTNDLHKDTTIVNIAQLTKPSRILIEQDSDPTLLNFKREMLGLPFDEQILLNDARYMHYSRNKKRIIIKDDILYRQYYNDIGEVSHLQVLLPGQLLKVLLQSLHGTAGKHPGISKMMQEIRQKYYFPSIAPYVRNWVRDCEICIHDKRINNTRITPELIHIPEWDLGPEDLMQIDLLPELPPSGGYENIITAIDVFSRYAFAYPVSNPTAVNTAKVIIDIMTRHAYLPTLIITDKGSVFVSQVIHEVAEILGINLKHATTKHAQTIGVLERAHATIKTSLKMASGEYRKQWHKYLPIAILNYNTTYHSSIDCEPSRVFHGRVPHNILDHKLGLRFNPNITPTTDFAEELLRRTKILYDKTKKNVMQSYIKYKRYYDKKAKASPLKEKDHCFILQPKADHQGSKIPFRDFRWIGPYLVEKLLPNNNYIVRKLNTNKTQILHRIRLRKYNPEKPPEDNYSEVQWQTDDNIVVPQDDLYTIAWEAEFGGHLFDMPIIYTDPNAIDFDESHTQGPDTVIVPRSYHHDPSDGQIRETCPISDPSLPQTLMPKLNGQNQDIETTIDLTPNDDSEQTDEPNTDTETTCEPIPQPPLRLCDTPTTLEINDPTTENIPQIEPSHSRGAKYNLRPNPNPNYSEIYRYWCAQKF